MLPRRNVNAKALVQSCSNKTTSSLIHSEHNLQVVGVSDQLDEASFAAVAFLALTSRFLLGISW